MTKYFYILLILTVSLFFVSKSDFNIVYADSGYMWIQIIDLIQNDYSTFSYKYSGISFDPKGEFLPFTSPFIGSYKEKFFIDFPPYFPLLASIPRYFTNNNISIYILELISLSLGLYSFFLLFYFHTKKISISIIFTIILLYCTTLFTYNLAIHEYSIAIGLLFTGLFFLNDSDRNNKSFFYSAFLLGLSLYFRLEFIFTIISWLLVSLLYKKYSLVSLIFKFGITFTFILFFLFLINYNIHGHPLGFRYLLTMTNPDTITIPRSDIIYDLFFNKIRGFFYQSPYLLFFIFIGILQISYARIKKRNINKKQEFYFYISFLIFFSISFSAPNHGDHISPRYLFGIYPSLFLFGYFTHQNIKETKIRKIRIVYYILLIIMLAFSFSQLIKNIKFISSSDKVVRILSNIVSEQKEMNIVYLDQVLPKNLQSIHFNKNFYYSEIDKIPYFLKISKIDPENLLFVSSTHSNKCFLNGKLCEDRPSIMNLHFYKISN